MTTRAEFQAVDWPAFVKRYLDDNQGTFRDSAEAAIAMDRHVRAEFGPCDTWLVALDAGIEFNRRRAAEQTERRYRNAEWLEDARAGFAALSADDQREFADAVALGMV